MGRRKKEDRAFAPPSYMGGYTFLSKDGYVLEHLPSHHRASSRDGMVPQHILVAEDRLGKNIGREFEIHHVDMNKSNNSPDNLVVLTPKEHKIVHRQNDVGGIHNVDPFALRDYIRDHGLVKACKKFRISTATVRSVYPEMIQKKVYPSTECVAAAFQELGTVADTAARFHLSQQTLKKHYGEVLPVKKVNLLEDEVRKALQGRSTLEASKILGVHHMTLRNKFDHLLKKRRSPCDPSSPETIRIVLEYASDKKKTIRALALDHGISQQVAAKICASHNVEWKKNLDRKGVSGRPKKSILSE